MFKSAKCDEIAGNAPAPSTVDGSEIQLPSWTWWGLNSRFLRQVLLFFPTAIGVTWKSDHIYKEGHGWAMVGGNRPAVTSMPSHVPLQLAIYYTLITEIIPCTEWSLCTDIHPFKLTEIDGNNIPPQSGWVSTYDSTPFIWTAPPPPPKMARWEMMTMPGPPKKKKAELVARRVGIPCILHVKSMYVYI